jgi:hypothetical protein
MPIHTDATSCSAFDQHQRIATGTLAEVTAATKQALDAGTAGPVLIFDDHSSHQIELDFRGSPDDVMARLPPAEAAPAPSARGPGRPKLGVTSREVTLLPRHWAWLARQQGGASAVLRRLVEQAQRSGAPKERMQQAMEAVERFMQAMTGDFRGHEEASRAFYRGEREQFAALTEHWPADVRDHLRRLVARAWSDHLSE